MVDKKTIVITGAAGFIGSNITEAISEAGEFKIIAVDQLASPDKKKNLARLKYDEYFEYDEFLNKLEKNQIPDIDTIIHLGACTDTTVMDRDYMLKNNTEYSKKIFDLCVKNNIKLIYASSAATYGKGGKGFSDETRDLEPLNCYGESKYLFDEYVLDSETKPKQWVGLKFFNVYGRNEDYKGKMASMVYQCYNQAVNNKEIKLFKASKDGYKNGEEKRDFIYVKDIVKIILFFLNNEVSGIFNAGTGKARTFLDLAQTIFKNLDMEEKISFFDMPEEIKDKYQYFTQANIDNLRNAGYSEEFFTLEEGVKDYIKNYH